MAKDKELGIKTAQVLTDMPVCFTVNGVRLHLYPQVLGRLYLTAQIVERLELLKENLSTAPYLELLRCVGKSRKECCTLVAYYTLKTKGEMLDAFCVDDRAKIIDECCSDEEIATLLSVILNAPTVDDIVKGYSMDKETRDMEAVNKAKGDKSTFVFGGKTIWGSLIDAACERYGWSFDYVVWKISYNNLTLMLKDKITTIYLSDDERKRCHISRNRDIINGDDKEALARAIKSGAI